jgi:uncharacterized protein (TIGR00288 family)
MAAFPDNASMALFCDFENIALGVRDAQYEKFDIRPVLERLLAKGSIVVKKAYCDWERYKGFKAAMHEANFELIEIPHVRQSGKNSADIRMVVDALDLCYTKAHVDTFVVISGDSDFSPLVSKLRENAKRVIGVGVKQSCSDLLVTNCDEFIYYDDLVRDREASKGGQRREREKRSPEEEARRREKQDERTAKAMDIVHATFSDLIADRGESERIWASVLKEVIKRRNPGFNESYFGFRTFGNLLEEAASRGLLGFGRDDKGAFVFRSPVRQAGAEPETVPEVASGDEPAAVDAGGEADSGAAAASEPPAGARRRGGRRARAARDRLGVPSPGGEAAPPAAAAEIVQPAAAPVVEESKEAKPARSGRRPRKAPADAAEDAATPVAAAVEPAPATAAGGKPAKSARATRSPRVRKVKADIQTGED